MLISSFVCMFVCLFVTLSHHISWTNRQIITKLGPHMELGTAKRPIDFGVDDITDDVIRSKDRSNFEIVISQAVFKVQHRNKNWNAALIMGHYSVMDNFRCHFRLNTKFWHQNGGHFENAKILHAASIWYQIWKDLPKLCKKKYFSWWWRHPWRHRVTSKSPLYVPL